MSLVVCTSTHTPIGPSAPAAPSAANCRQRSILSDDVSLATAPDSPRNCMPHNNNNTSDCYNDTTLCRIRDVQSIQDDGYTDTHIVLGEGAESRVVRYRTKDGADVAVKVISKLLHPTHCLQTQEVQHLRSLGDHPSVIRYLDAMQTSSEVYIVTEEFGIDLDRWQLQLKQKLSLLPSEYLQNIRGVTRQLLRAIHDLHSVGVVHRDIKLHNVLIRAGEVKLIDFGAATIVSEDMALQSPVIRLPIKGTLGYLAPEVLAQASTHVFECHLAELPALDMFALGAVVYQLLYGRAPFRVSDLADIAKGQPDPFAVKSSALLQRMVRSPPYYPRGLGNIVVDADAKEFVMNLLRLDPKERWTSAQALASPWMTKNIEL